MIINYNKRLREIMKNPTILSPSKHFIGLSVSDKDFLSLDEFLDRSREETIKKVYALRELCNNVLSAKSIVNSAIYSEYLYPEFVLLFSKDEATYAIKEMTYLDENKHISDPEKKSTLDPYKSYSITQETLDYLLDPNNKGTALDNYIRETFKEFLELYREYIKTEVLYPDIKVTDSTGCVKIETNHNNYFADGINDSFIIPIEFGAVSIKYKKLFSGINFKYSPSTNTLQSSSLIECKDVGKRLYIHKGLLPDCLLRQKNKE